MHRTVIVNSTPLIILCKTGRLALLRELYGKILIPEAVYSEVTAKTDSACRQIKEQDGWIEIKQVRETLRKKMYHARLHDGEVEVMILAQEVSADLVIIDDLAAKKTAKYLGLPVTGTIGVLLRAKREGCIESISKELERMKQCGFYVSRDVESMALKSAGEI